MPRYIAGLDLIVTPSDVKALEAKVNNDFLTLQASVDTSNLASDLLAAWNGFTAEWKGWLAANPDIGTLPITYLQQKHELTDFEVRFSLRVTARVRPCTGVSLRVTARSPIEAPSARIP